MTTPEMRDFLTVDEMAAEIKVSAKHIRREIERGNLRVHRFGKLIRTSPDDWKAYKARHRGKI